MTVSDVRLVQICKRYGNHPAVDHVDLFVESGTLVTLLGPSGCGKTTTLRLVAGLELPTSGKVLIAGQDVSHLPADARNIAMVFQSYALFPHLTVQQNIAYGLTVRRIRKREAHARANETMEMVGLKGLGDRFPAELSGGQQQRVAVARALILEPGVLLFDEPLSNLDARLRRQVRQEIRDLQQRLNLTVLYVTHDQNEALAISDRIVLMEAGKVAQDDAPRELFERPRNRFVAQFIGEANVLPAQIIWTTDRTRTAYLGLGTRATRFQFDPGTLPTHLDQSRWLVLRPEALRIHPGGSPAGHFPGRVRSSSYLGAFAEYVVETDAGEILVIQPSTANLHAAGAVVEIEVMLDAANLTFID